MIGGKLQLNTINTVIAEEDEKQECESNRKSKIKMTIATKQHQILSGSQSHKNVTMGKTSMRDEDPS